MYTYPPHTLLVLTPSSASFLMRLSLSDLYIRKKFVGQVSPTGLQDGYTSLLLVLISMLIEVIA